MFVELPLGRRSNLNVQGGLSFRPFASPRFELRVSVGLWKPKTNQIGMRAAAASRAWGRPPSTPTIAGSTRGRILR